MVETFINPEHECLIIEPSDLEKWHALVEKLGLKGQAQLTKDGKSPIPFPAMTNSMIAVYKVLCPEESNLNSFGREAIPLRVLEIADLCKTEGYFKEIYVWHNLQKEDPILVGSINGYTWTKDGFFLLARWGDELRSFVELKQLALKNLIRDKRNALTAGIAAMKAQLETIDSLAESHLDGNDAQWMIK